MRRHMNVPSVEYVMDDIIFDKVWVSPEPRLEHGCSRLERWPRMAECLCSQGWRKGTIAMDGKMP
ncbi:hypothetical protein [Desulfosporosinus burensis]